MAARALLNRAVYSSPTDARFVCKLRRLAEEVPGQLLDALLTSASLDVSQTLLFHELLTLAPQLAQFVPEAGGVALILVRLRGLIDLAPQLPESRRAAVLAFLSLLHRPSSRRPSVAAALAAAANGAVDTDAVDGEAQMVEEPEWSDEALEDIDDLDETACEVGVEGTAEENGVKGEGLDVIGAQGDANAPSSIASEPLRPLMRSSLLLVEVLLPHLRCSARPSSTALALNALQVARRSRSQPWPLQAHAPNATLPGAAPGRTLPVAPIRVPPPCAPGLRSCSPRRLTSTPAVPAAAASRPLRSAASSLPPSACSPGPTCSAAAAPSCPAGGAPTPVSSCSCRVHVRGLRGSSPPAASGKQHCRGECNFTRGRSSTDSPCLP